MSRLTTRSELDRDPPIAEQGVLAARPENHSSDWLISAAMNIGQTVTNCIDCKVYARTTAESVTIAVKTSTPPTA